MKAQLYKHCSIATVLLMVFISVFLLPAGVSAETYPSKPINLLVAFAPGGKPGRYNASSGKKSRAIPGSTFCHRQQRRSQWGGSSGNRSQSKTGRLSIGWMHECWVGWNTTVPSCCVQAQRFYPDHALWSSPIRIDRQRRCPLENHERVYRIC